VIPFNRPALAGGEIVAMEDAVARGRLSGDGFYTRRCQARLAEILGGGQVLLTTSCTDALELAALLLDIQPGDEVVIPTFTFVSTVNAFVLRGARPVFVDVRPDTLNLDEQKLAAALGPRTRGIVPVHYAGIGCEMERILEIAGGVPVIEDNAHGLFGSWRGQPLGRFGALSTLSFHETKNVFCGEGGALVINDPALGERAEILREKGTDRSKFFRGEVDRYTWVDVGSSFLPSDLLAAFLSAQLAAWEATQRRRGEIWQRYATELADWAERRGARLPVVPPGAVHPSHLFYLLLADEAERDSLIAHLQHRGVQAVFHYLPLHLSPMGRRFGGREGDCPVAESASGRLLRLPLFSDLTMEEQGRVIAAVREF
jgi:dTDP-4-amino-4,6-dideoxygalactose transaminase